jgi:serine/threonine-protein kinase
MAVVHLARMVGAVGFARTVAVKRLHAHLAQDPEFTAMFVDEARLAARVRHPNVVPTLDVVADGGELFLVMEYVAGASLSQLNRAARANRERVPIRVLSAILSGALYGLHAAHEAKSEQGEPLGIVHRDVSPQNIMVGIDGVARVLDFGIAKAAGRVQTTRDGQIKGKAAYMSREQLDGKGVDARTDVYAIAVVMWEALTGERLFTGDTPEATLTKVLAGASGPPSSVVQGISAEVDAIVMKGLAREPKDRFDTARAMAIAIEETVPPATAREVGEWVERLAGSEIALRAHRIIEIESQPTVRSAALPATIDVATTTTTSSVAMSPRTSRTRIWLPAAIALVVSVAVAVIAWSSKSPVPAPTTVASAAPTVTVTVTVVETVTAPPPSAPASAPTVITTHRPTTTTTAPPHNDCTPPYVLDAKGHRVPKPGCF